MGENYQHLTWRERLIIETRLKDGWSKQRIADELGRHVSTIYREIKRGLGIQRTTELIDRECYIPDIAQARYEDHYPDKGPGLKIGKDHRLARYLEAAHQRREQIAGGRPRRDQGKGPRIRYRDFRPHSLSLYRPRPFPRDNE